MNLKGINVLVDGYNIELAKGTGIKTYGISLTQALNLLEANVDVLFSRSSSSSDPILNEVLFFDNQNGSFDKISLLKAMAKGVSGFFKARRIEPSELIIKSEFNNQFINSIGILNLKACYLVANTLHKNFRLKTEITTPKKIDIWHSTYPLPIKIRGAKKLTTIHDLIPLRLPYTTLDNKKTFYSIIKDSIKDSQLIITVSENSKEDILNIFNVAQDKVHVTYQPIVLNPFMIEEDKIATFLKRHKIKVQKYILFVGAIEPKKNLGRLIDAYAEIDTDMPLVIVGKKGWLWEGEIGKLEAIFGKNFPRKVKILDYVSNTDLKYFYLGAYCLVFPSLYEGFGLPPLEAMNFGCPVITSNVASLPEICGDAALYVNPYDVDDIRKKIEELINYPQIRAKLSEAGRERVKLFSMDNYVNKLYKAYQKIL